MTEAQVSAASATIPDDPSATKTDVEAAKSVKNTSSSDEVVAVEDDVAPVGYWKMFRYATGRQWALTLVGLTLSWFNGASLPAFALLFGDLVDSLNGDGSAALDEARSIAGWFAVVAAGTFVASYCEVALTMLSAGEQISVVRFEYLRALLYQDIGFHDKNKAGDMASRLAEQSTTMVTGMGNKLGATGHHLGTFVGGLAVGFFFSPELTGVILAFFPGFIVAGSLLEMSGSKFEKRIADAYASANAIASEAVTSIKTVIAFSRERSEIKRYEDNLGEAQKQGTNRAAVSGVAWGLFNFVMFCAYGVGCWYGAQLIVRDREDDPAKCDPNVIFANTGELSFDQEGCVTGGIVLSVFFGVLIGGFSLAQAGPNFGAFASARAAAAKLFDVIDKKPVVDSTGASGGRKVDPASFKGRIELRNATFRYPTRPNEIVLKNVSMVIEPGQQVALVGPSGSGKSTIIGLLQRWYDLESGALLIDGVDIKEYDPVSLRASMGLILQNPILFDTTVRENVAFGVGGLDKVQGDTVEQACRAANAEGFILEKEEGYDYQVGVRGNKLSGGQRQRICIARAVARNPAILLADEATSALDNESEVVVQQSLDKLLAESGGKRTSIVIAHRLSTIRGSNKIFVLDHGTLVEEGSHDELMQQDEGLYRKLYMLSQEEGAAHEEAAEEDAADGVAAGTDAPAMARAKSTGSVGKNPVTASVAPASSKSTAAGGDAEAAADDEFEAQLDEVEPRVKSSCFGLCKKVETKEEKEARLKLERYPAVPSWRVFREYQWQDRWVLAAAVFFAAINGTIFPMFALIFTEITTTMFNLDANQLEDDALDLLVLFIILATVSLVANLGQFFLFGYAGERLTKRLRAATFKAVMRQDATFFDARANTPGRVAARLSADAALVRATTGEAVGVMVQNLVALGVGIGIAFESSWRLTLVLIATVPFMMVAATLETQFFTEQGAQGASGGGFKEAAAVALEAVSAVRTVNAFALQERVLGMFRSAMDVSAPEDRQRALFAGFAFGISQGIMFLIYSLCFYVGTEFIAEGFITFDELFRVFFVVTMAAYGAGQAASMATDSAKAEPAKRSIFALLDAKPGINAVEPVGDLLEEAKGDLEFHNVTFAYPSAPDKPVLKDFTLTVKHGQTVALVGPSGSGKSTVVAMLQRQYDPQSGAIKVDGADIRSYNPVSYRNQFGFVPQEPTLFQEPLSYNVAYGRKVDPSASAAQDTMGVTGNDASGKTAQDVLTAVQSANALDFVNEFSQGFETNAGQNGSALSGGQKQRIAIARAIVRQPTFLLLDEATAALDNETERIVQASIDELLADGSSRTTVVIAHRLSTIRQADVICVVVDGRIREQGSHADLMDRQGLYYKLVKAGGRSSAMEEGDGAAAPAQDDGVAAAV